MGEHATEPMSHRPPGISIPTDRSVRVPRGSLRGRPKADGWPGEDGSPRHTGATRRGTVDNASDGVIPTNPSPRRRHKPKTPVMNGEAGFAHYKKSDEACFAVHRPPLSPEAHGRRPLPRALTTAPTVILGLDPGIRLVGKPLKAFSTTALRVSLLPSAWRRCRSPGQARG